MLEIEIDGAKVSADPGEMLIAVTDRAGIRVPRFCYHKHLSIAANCRMCLVDIEGSPKPKPACSTPIAEGMKIWTHNDKTKISQKAVMEFLLINHPLDCPICDQGGECELQDVAMDYGADISRFTEGKRIVEDKDIGALIQTDMTRCIHCTRCVRFGDEIAGVMEMGATGRGENLKIEPFLAYGIDSELSGNMIDICPVGALTSKPFRYELRSWQMQSVAGVSRHDLVGSNLLSQTYKGKVKRIVARENSDINETWIADRERFSYQGLSHENRLLMPQIKIEGKWQEVTWNVALDFALKGLNNAVLNNKQTDRLGALATNTATLEEFYLLQKILRGVGTQNIDYRLNIKDLDATINLPSNIKLTDLETLDYGLIIGANLRLEQPLINHRLRKAVLSGAMVDVVNVAEFDFNYQPNNHNIIAPNQIALLLAGVLKVVLESTQAEVLPDLQNLNPNATAKQLAARLLRADNAVIVLGEHLLNIPQVAIIAALITQIAQHTDSKTLNTSLSANSKAADLAGFTPGRDGLDANTMLTAQLKAYILLDIYPQYDFYNSPKAIEAFNNADTFIIALNSFKDEVVLEYADILLPIANFYESPGSHVNIEGLVQSFPAAVSAPGEAKPAWKVFKVLADLLQLPGFDYTANQQITSEATMHQNPKLSKVDVSKVDVSIDLTMKKGIDIIWQKSPYAIDVLLRHSPALQMTKIGQINTASMNAATAKKLKLTQTDDYLGVPVVLSETVADDCVFINANRQTWDRGQ